jgi:Na+/glutamate symporter
VERVIEGRPYRSKLELVSRMVIPEPIYAGIRDKIAVAEARDPIKVA